MREYVLSQLAETRLLDVYEAGKKRFYAQLKMEGLTPVATPVPFGDTDEDEFEEPPLASVMEQDNLAHVSGQRWGWAWAMGSSAAHDRAETLRRRRREHASLSLGGENALDAMIRQKRLKVFRS